MSQTPDATLVSVFIALQISGALGFFVIILTAALSSRVTRHPTWFSFCSSWMLWGISFSLLFFAGQQTQPKPSPALCVVQSALAYTMPHLTGLTSVALILYLLLTVRSALMAETVNKRPRIMWSLVWVPWLLGTIYFVAFLIYMVEHPNDVRPSHYGTYCVVENSYLPKITASLASVLAIMIVVLEVVIGVILFRHRSVLDGFPQSTSLAFQLLLFTAVVLCGVAVSLIFLITSVRSAALDVVLGVLPLSASVIFGSQRDILLSWMFWRSPSTTFDSRVNHGSTIADLSSIEPDEVISQRV